MAKYNEFFKRKVIDTYLAGEGGYTTIAKRLGDRSKANVRTWVDRLIKPGKFFWHHET